MLLYQTGKKATYTSYTREGVSGMMVCHKGRAVVFTSYVPARTSGGDAHIVRLLPPLLESSGLQFSNVSPRQIYVDAYKP